MAAFERIDRISQEAQRNIDSHYPRRPARPAHSAERGPSCAARSRAICATARCACRFWTGGRSQGHDGGAAEAPRASCAASSGRRVDLRYAPEILFELDTNIEYAAKIDQHAEGAEKAMEHRATTDELARWLAARGGLRDSRPRHRPTATRLGSCVAVALALRAHGQARRVPACPAALPKISIAKYAHADEVLRPEDVLPLRAEDGAFAGRVRDRGPAWATDGALFEGCAETRHVLDHHATNPGFGDVWLRRRPCARPRARSRWS